MSLHVGDIGTKIILTIKENGVVVPVDGVSTKSVVLRKPSGTVVTKDAEFYTDGTDGNVMYVTITDDLDEDGIWHAQAFVTGLDGWSGHSDKVYIEVKPNL